MGIPQDASIPEISESEGSLPFPTQRKQIAGNINEAPIDVMANWFSDKIVITISQNGKLAQWVSVPLLSENPLQSDPYFHRSRPDDEGLLPASRFTPRTLLGAGSSDRELIGHLYASQIAHAITAKTPEESRSLLLGMGIDKTETNRDEFLQIMDLVLKIL